MPYRWKDDKRAYMQEWCQKSNSESKEAILNFYGRKCNWPGCTWTDPRALQLDHINGNGHLERKHFNDYRTKWKRVQEAPDEYQLLCANHNWVKRSEKKEFIQPLEINRSIGALPNK
jgi:hypothetical protein